MNVADTKPYNADFDGDEMNLRMPQDVERKLSCVIWPLFWQIISPANNNQLWVFFKIHSGNYQFTREGNTMSQRTAMNLHAFQKIDITSFPKTSTVTANNVISQIMPPLFLNTKQNGSKILKILKP